MKEMDEKLGENDFLEDDNFDEAIPIQTHGFTISVKSILIEVVHIDFL